MRFLRGILVAGVAWFAAGCMQFEYGITLDDDLSGTADLDITIDLDRVAYMSAFIQNAFEGEGGEPTAEQVEAAREELLKEMEQDDDLSEESLRAEIEPDLPDGVTLVHAKADQTELKTTIDVRLAFDHVDKLKDLKFDDGDGDGEDEGSIDSEPFQGLEIVEQGDEIIVRNDPIDPTSEMEDVSLVSDEMLEKMLEGFGITFKLTTPFEIVEHNASRKDGRTLVWEYNYETLEAGKVAGIYARLKR